MELLILLNETIVNQYKIKKKKDTSVWHSFLKFGESKEGQSNLPNKIPSFPPRRN